MKVIVKKLGDMMVQHNTERQPTLKERDENNFGVARR